MAQDNLHGQHQQLQVTPNKVINITADGRHSRLQDDIRSNAELMLFRSQRKEKSCRKTGKCKKKGGICQETGTCEGKEDSGCKNGCSCCLPAIHGQWSSWSLWGMCTKTCGGGSRQRSRQCNNPTPANNGRLCSGSDKETGDCNSQACGSECIDKNKYCQDWADKGECQKNPEYMIPNCPKACDKCELWPPAYYCVKMTGFCLKSGDHCNGTIEIFNTYGNDECCCCLPLPPVPNSLCSKMHGYCQKSDDCQCLGMSINNITLNTKYCGSACESCCAPSGQVFKADIENSLSYALRLLKPNLNGTTNGTNTTLDSTTCADLKKFTNILRIFLHKDQYIQGHTHRFINKLDEAIKKRLNDHPDFNFNWLQTKLDDIQDLPPKDTFINGVWRPSVSCHNIYQGNCFWRYTCGLWNIFHTLTVSADNSDNPLRLDVLGAIHGYVVNFLGCDICGPHFGHMYNQTIVQYGDSIVNTTDKAILWLWCAHNVVNQRHTSHPISQPHPQFPIKSVCPWCWREAKDPPEVTTCPDLFCGGKTGVGKCFKVQEDLKITYDPFSKTAVLLYLKGLYGGSYSDLNASTVKQSLDHDGNDKCPIYN